MFHETQNYLVDISYAKFSVSKLTKIVEYMGKIARQKISRSAKNVLLNEKSVHQAQLRLLCTVVPVGYMFRPYMRVIIRPLYKCTALKNSFM